MLQNATERVLEEHYTAVPTYSYRLDLRASQRLQETFMPIHDHDGYFAQMLQDHPGQADIIYQFARCNGITFDPEIKEANLREITDYNCLSDHNPCPVSVEELIDLLKIYRHQKGLSQADFSRVIGINLRTYQDWEQGRRKPSGPSTMYLRQWWLSR